MREIEQHLRHVYTHVDRVFRNARMMPVRNLLETLASQIRHMSEQRDTRWSEYRSLETAYDELRERANRDMAGLTRENERLRRERNEARTAHIGAHAVSYTHLTLPTIYSV